MFKCCFSPDKSDNTFTIRCYQQTGLHKYLCIITSMFIFISIINHGWMFWKSAALCGHSDRAWWQSGIWFDTTAARCGSFLVREPVIGRSESRCARSCQSDAAPLFPEQPEGELVKRRVHATTVPVCSALLSDPVPVLTARSRRRICAEKNRDMV